jgi:5-methylcytosine-specific restriction endonuclease McrA
MKAICACGCNSAFEPRDARGRLRSFIHGHNRRKKQRKPIDREAARLRSSAWYYSHYNLQRINRNLNASALAEKAKERYWRNVQAGREHGKHKVSKRRARKYLAQGSHSIQQWMARVEFFGWRCRYCGLILNKQTLTTDHVIPLSRGGAEWSSNLVPACKHCNYQKNTKTLHEFAAYKEGICARFCCT